MQYRVAEALILGSMIAGQSVAFAPDYQKGILAASRVFHILNKRPNIDVNWSAGLTLVRKILKSFSVGYKWVINSFLTV